jgi:hypothetical protein
MTAKLTAIGMDKRGRWRTKDLDERSSSPTRWTTVDKDEHLGLNPVCAAKTSWHYANVYANLGGRA